MTPTIFKIAMKGERERDSQVFSQSVTHVIDFPMRNDRKYQITSHSPNDSWITPGLWTDPM